MLRFQIFFMIGQHRGHKLIVLNLTFSKPLKLSLEFINLSRLNLLDVFLFFK
jgi:hypothetical protein